ncbi:MAG: ATP-binding protein [Acidobacteriota bacterium]|nr:ATP-binding protein [Acidobacteriota bacterium]
MIATVYALPRVYMLNFRAVTFINTFMNIETNDNSFDSGSEPKPRRRAAPWLLGGLVLLLLSVLVAQQVFGLWEIYTPDTASDTLLAYALSSLNFVAFFVFTFILLRHLLKLRRERRERQLGSKIKTRLVVYFIAVSLLPITAMAVFSYIFFNRSLEKWFSSLPEGVVREANAVQRGESLRQSEDLRELASAIAVLLEMKPAGEGAVDLQSVAERGRLVLLAVSTAETTSPATAITTTPSDDVSLVTPSPVTVSPITVPPVAAPSYSPSYHAAREDVGQEILRRVPESGGGFVTEIGGTAFDVVALPLAGGAQLIAARERQSDPALGNLVAGARTFEDFKRRQRKVRLLGLSTLGLLTLMLLFAATWSAIHLARGIGTPIRALAEASDEVARGNLDHRVTAIADDELAVLAESFNQMTAQLSENRRRIEAGATELREKNIALAERRDYIETVLESLSTGVISLDADDRLTTINHAAVSMLRLGQAPPAGTLFSDAVGGEDRDALDRVLWRARMRGRAVGQVELSRFNHGGGDAEAEDNRGVIPVALTATALPQRSDGGGRSVVLMMEDLTELLVAQRAAAWSEVARRMAHEIKNPLTPIQLSAERIARNFARRPEAGNGEASRASLGSSVGNIGSNSVEQEVDHSVDTADRQRIARLVEECTATIIREVAGLKAMVDEFTRFARLPHARLEVADLNEVVRQAVALYEERLGDARMDVRLAHTLPGALIDTEQLRRVFVNMIDNALEALTDAPGEQRITVATGHDPARGLLLAEVTDTGQGIEREDFPRLFSPYFSTRGRGTGLGLAIVQRVIAEHGGRIRAESNRPRGARFIIELPIAEEGKWGPGGGGQEPVSETGVNG